jgi:CubicO group peptidase (beta-lactamase class C family)
MTKCHWLMAIVILTATRAVRAEQPWDWSAATPESQGMSSATLEKAWDALKARSTTGFLVIRNDCVVFERYAPGWDRHKPHGTASMAKALVGGTSLIVAMTDHRIRPDDPAGKFIPQWRDIPRKKDILIRHLATHTSGIEDAEQDDLPHDQLTGWKGDFWKRLPVPNDPFSIARDVAPVLDVPGTKDRYSNPGMAMLAYCITNAIKDTPDPDLRSLLKHRVLDPIGAAPGEWSIGYGKPVALDGLSLFAPWGGASYSPDVTARVGRLMMQAGDWQGHQLLDPDVVRTATSFAGMPNHCGLGWWVNHNPDGSKYWKDAPADAFSGSGAGQQFLMVAPSLNLIIVRNGADMDAKLGHFEGLERYVISPLMRTITGEANKSR